MNPKPWQITLMACAVAVLSVFLCSTAFAFASYEECKDCHGEFRDSPYTSLQDATNWGDDLMDGHGTFVGDNCDACHQAGDRSDVLLNFSADATLSKGCVGCHGRDEDVTGNCTGMGDGMEAECGSGAGLRRYHETRVEADTCNMCHEANPTPAGEHIAPFNYKLSGVVMKSSCDSDGTESRFGATGLDDDGDGQRDANDSDCQTSNTAPTQPGAISPFVVSWGASTDADGDSISYQVDYRRNGDTEWTDGGNTSGTSQSLSGLDAGQSYDVRVTPNDGTEDGPARTALNLFQTDAGNTDPPGG